MRCSLRRLNSSKKTIININTPFKIYFCVEMYISEKKFRQSCIQDIRIMSRITKQFTVVYMIFARLPDKTIAYTSKILTFYIHTYARNFIYLNFHDYSHNNNFKHIYAQQQKVAVKFSLYSFPIGLDKKHI